MTDSSGDHAQQERLAALLAEAYQTADLWHENDPDPEKLADWLLARGVRLASPEPRAPSEAQLVGLVRQALRMAQEANLRPRDEEAVARLIVGHIFPWLDGEPPAGVIERVMTLMEAEWEVYVVRGDRGVSFTAADKAAIRERVLRAARVPPAEPAA